MTAPAPACDRPAERAGDGEGARDLARRRRAIPWLAGALVAGALGAAVLGGGERAGAAPVLLGALIATLLLLDAVRIDLFERLRTSPAALAVLPLAAVFGPLGPVAGEAAIALTRIARRDPPVRFAFDFGALGLAGAAAAGVFAALPAHGGDLLGVGALAAVAYYAVNIPLLALVLWLSRGTSPRESFREQLAWLLPHYVAFGTLAGVFLIAHERLGYSSFLIFGVPAAVLWVAEKQYVARSRTNVRELRQSHEELEAANARLRQLLEDNDALLLRLQQSYLSTITSLARTIEAKDPYTSGHTERVARVASALAVELGFRGDDLRAIEVGAVIHDIGKIGVRDSTLLKTGALDDCERLEMERHPEISSYIVADLDLPEIVKAMVRSHHERFDGRGYPDGLSGAEIPLAARMLCVADAFDAMTSDRSYRTAMPIADALAVIDANTGTQFCPTVVAALHACLDGGAAFGSRPPVAERGPATVHA